MNESQPGIDSLGKRAPSDFFARSPFRSWMFLINTGLFGTICLAVLWILWRFWDKLTQGSAGAPLVLLVLFVTNVLYPYCWALIRHRKVNRLYLAGHISEQPTGSPTAELLSVASESLNEGLRNTMVCFGLFLIGLVLWHLLPSTGFLGK
jgi:hypothetical protein